MFKLSYNYPFYEIWFMPFGNILIDADEGRGGFKDISQTLVLELE